MIVIDRFPLREISNFVTNQHVHNRLVSFQSLFYRRRERSQWRLKYCTAFSCFFAAVLVLNVPRFLRLPVFGFFLREYRRYLPDFSFLIIASSDIRRWVRWHAAIHRASTAHRWMGFFKDDARKIAEGAEIQGEAACLANALFSTRSTYALLKRFERPSASRAARIAEFVTKWAGKLQCWLA